MFDGRKSLLDGRADRSHRHDVGEVEIADDGAPHQPAALVRPGQIARRHHGDRVGPRDRSELVLPPREHDVDVEPQQENHVRRVHILAVAKVPHGSLEFAAHTRGSRQHTHYFVN